MNIGDYVRTKDGIIWKPNKIEEIVGKWFFDDYYLYDKDYIKSSPNIIDLIAEGDYVNGKEVIAVDTLTKQIVYEYGECDGFIEEKYIYSIVTKEQFESMEYKVGGKK